MMNNPSTQILNAIRQTAPIAGQQDRNEVSPAIVEVLGNIANHLRRIADHFDPAPPDIVDTPYIAKRLGVTTTRIAQMVREGMIPKSCIVPGTGNGRLWKFHRRQLEEWLSRR